MSQLCVLVHTFEGYHHLWNGHFKAHRENWHLKYPEVYLGTDVESPCHHFFPHPFKPIYSGIGEWSDRLKKLLLQLPYDYVLYMQEDHYPTEMPPIGDAWEIMDRLGLYRLQLSPVNQFYNLYGSKFPLFFHHTSKYLVSHQPSIWKKSFLLECLESGESPWINEYEGTKRLQKRDDIHGKIAIYPCDWFSHKCIKGKVVE